MIKLKPIHAMSFKNQVMVNAGLIVASAVVLSVALVFLSKDVQEEASAISERRRQIQLGSTSVEELALLKKMEGQADEYLKVMESVIPTKDELLDFPRWLEGLGRLYNLSPLFSFKGEETLPQGSLPGYVPFELNVEGSRKNLMSLLNDLENKPRQFLLAFEDVEVKRISESEYRVIVLGRLFFKE